MFRVSLIYSKILFGPRTILSTLTFLHYSYCELVCYDSHVRKTKHSEETPCHHIQGNVSHAGKDIHEGDKNGSQRTQWSLKAKDKEQTDRPQKAKCSCSHNIKGTYSRQEYMILRRNWNGGGREIFKKTRLRAKRMTVFYMTISE